MKYFLVGYYGYGNSGDQACLVRVQQVILANDSHAVFKILYPTKESNFQTVDRWSVVAIFKALCWADKVVFGGGSLLQNRSSTASLLYYLSLIGGSFLCCTPVIMLGQGFGPVTGRFARSLVRLLLMCVKSISVRDQVSYNRLVDLCKKPLFLSSDLVFYQAKKPLLSADDTVKIGIAFRPTLLKDSTELSLFNVLQSYSNKLHYFAFSAQEDLRLYHHYGIYGSQIHLVHDFFKFFENDDLLVMVAMRYHACAWAAFRGIPFLALAYDDKVTQFAQIMGQECVVMDDNELDVTSVIQLLDRVVDQRSFYQEQLVIGFEKQMELACLHDKALG
ncbi:hypothetical protein DID76_03770 [Candidatus Marinamargulisbacteria bacterium SCGC AG-414-C22]|nr:hypothetical protein DID76_03770 [Candidatus Marinamargulisbacteria bacterium SCGC AG-414-C22]